MAFKVDFVPLERRSAGEKIVCCNPKCGEKAVLDVIEPTFTTGVRERCCGSEDCRAYAAKRVIDRSKIARDALAPFDG